MAGLFSKIAKFAGLSDKETDNCDGGLGAKDLLIKVLEKLNCTVEEDEKDRFIFTFQGEHFVAYAYNDCRIVDVWDMYWYQVDLDDIDSMARARKAVNEVNIKASTTIVYTTDEENNHFDIHTKRAILLREQPDIIKYFSAMLGSFFATQREFVKTLDELKKKEDGEE